MAGTRQSHARKVFVYADGTEGRSAKPGWTHLKFEMFAPDKDEDDKPIVVDTFTIEAGAYSDEMNQCAIGYGLSQKLGDAYANLDKKAKDREEDFDPETGYATTIRGILEEWNENLLAGVWITESEGTGGGASVTILSEAIFAAFEEAGMDVTDEVKAQVMQNLKDETYRAASKKLPAVDKHVKRITAERAVKRSEEAAAKAAKAGKSAATDLAGLLGGAAS
jgi:hypothetical protein